MSTTPLLDERALERLAVELHGSDEVVRRFVDDFVEAWDDRIRRLEEACAECDSETAYVTLLSLRSTSEMVGAVALAALAGRLQQYASEGRMDACCAQEPALADVGLRTMAALRSRAA